ncbi:DUF4376 domain-containing protein [Macellibacteroides fermentans]|uniref:DUF4376 domain-containing protein n=1 Tax=Macellibacteroides fermentans TaxID=879969 RepID=UPI00406C2EF6
MSNFYSPDGNFEVWQEQPDGYFTPDEWAELHPAPVVEVSLEGLKEAKKAEISSVRYNFETAGIRYSDYEIATDRDSQALITGAALAAIQDSLYSVRWKTISGFITLNSDQILAVAHAVRAHVQGCFDTEADLITVIDTAETEADLDRITWP